MSPLVGRIILVALACGLLAPASAQAQLAPNTKDPLRIMQAVRDRDTGNRMTATVKMTITGSGPERKRVFAAQTLKFEGGVRRLFRFESPADVRATALLTYDYRDAKRDDAQWLYLPALKQSTRITSSRRSGSFVSSDFSFADLTLPDPESYDHRLVGDDAVNGEPCWVVESKPKTKKTEAETGYRESTTWVSKKTLLPLRFRGRMSGGRTKYIAISSVNVIQGIATPTVVTARIVAGGKIQSQTVLEQTGTRYESEAVRESAFSAQSLGQSM